MTSRASNMKGRSKAIMLNGRELTKTKLHKDQIEAKKESERLQTEIAEIKRQNDNLREENEKLKRKVDTRSVSNFENIDRMKSELDRLRSTNNFLLEDIERRKMQVSDAQTLAFELQMRLESASRENETRARENEKLQNKVQSLQNKQNKYKKLLEENNRLKGFLLNHKMDHKTGKFVGMKINKAKVEQTNTDGKEKDVSKSGENQGTTVTTVVSKGSHGRYVDIHRAKLAKSEA